MVSNWVLYPEGVHIEPELINQKEKTYEHWAVIAVPNTSVYVILVYDLFWIFRKKLHFKCWAKHLSSSIFILFIKKLWVPNMRAFEDINKS
jgi:hypothetical protein